MIQVTKTYKCRVCDRENIVKNGTNKVGQAPYHGKDCGASRVLEPKPSDGGRRREYMLRSYAERASLRGLSRIYGVARQTAMKWVQAHRQRLPSLLDSLLPRYPGDVLEVDELWSFVARQDNAVWLWTALCRRTRQIVAFVLGDRSADTCRRLWEAIPGSYRRCRPYSDFWQAYETVFSRRTHHLVGKKPG